MISTKNTDPTLTAALKVIASALKDAEPYSSYRLCRVRYNMLRNRGIKANMTYPRANPDIHEFKHIKPFQFRQMSRMSGAGSAPAAETFGSPNCMGKRTKLTRRIK